MANPKAGATGTNGAEEMAERGTRNAKGDPKTSSPRSSEISRGGVRTGEDFANLMSALMTDVIDGTITPNVANAAVNAGGKLLKVVEMQYRYGSPKEQKALSITLAPGA